MTQTAGTRHHAIVIGGGFGGLVAAIRLAREPIDVTLIDRRNFHFFQPLAYHVATGALSPAEICYRSGASSAVAATCASSSARS